MPSTENMLRMLRVIAAAALTAGVFAPASAQSPDRNLARNLASNCANCHGTNGQSTGAMPTLAGLTKDYIVAQMKDFRSGKRPATIMHQLSKGYSDDQIDLIAGYLSAQKPR